MRLCRRQLRWEPAGTANKCLANGPAAYDVLPEDANEKNYRAKRSDKFKEQSVLDIADHAWIGETGRGIARRSCPLGQLA